MSGAAEQNCSHCGIAFRWRPIEQVGDNGETARFCCRGCQGAWQLIQGAGLGSFYQRSDRTTPTVGSQEIPYSEEDLAQRLVPDGALYRLDIMIGGISCASCVWLLERLLGGMPGVEQVSMSYSGGSTSLRFDPQQVAPLEIFRLIARLGYSPRPYSPEASEEEARRERDDLLLRFGTALFLTMQLMAYSYALYAGYFQGMAPRMKQLLQYVSLGVTTPVVFYSGAPFLAGAWRSLRTRAPGMDLLIAVGALSAWLYSVWATFAGHETYYESAAMIVTFVLVGRLLELSVRRKALSGIGALYASAPQRAVLEEDGFTREVPVDEVHPGQILLVRQGERFPVDCLIIDGATEVDQSLVTGESLPVLVQQGGDVRAGCVNVSAPVRVQALRPAGQSYLMRVAALVQMAQAGKPSLQRLADRISAWFVPLVMILAVVVAAGRLFLLHEPAGTAIMAALAVVLIACPCAMGLAVPAAVLAACSRAASLGIILRGGDVIERLYAIDTALFDKTGTITQGEPELVEFTCHAPFTPEQVLTAAAGVEERAAHPLARSLVTHAARQGYLPAPCSDFTSVPGRGVSGRLPDGTLVQCGSSVWLNESGVAGAVAQAGGASVLIALDGRLAGACRFDDRPRRGGETMAGRLRAGGLAVEVISGDDPVVVGRVAAAIGVSAFRGAMTPDQKLAHVQELQKAGRRVLMAGDGVNDAPALAAANVSCSLTGSSDIALENADVIITGDDISRIAAAWGLARATIAVIRQNLAWAFVYNLIGIPLALSGRLTPVYAAVAMTASSLLVSLNSLRLMRFKHHG